MYKEFPKFQCHKTVHAAKIVRVIEQLHDGRGLLELEARAPGVISNIEWIVEKRVMDKSPAAGEYLVFYPTVHDEDPYVSISPPDAFEAGYLLMVSEATTQVSNRVDVEGMPAGGTVRGPGLAIDWQNGPLKDDDGNDLPRNGAFVLEALTAVTQRLEHYQDVADGRFRCRENALAITKLEEAAHWLQARLERRKLEGVLGTQKA